MYILHICDLAHVELAFHLGLHITFASPSSTTLHLWSLIVFDNARDELQDIDD